MSAIGSQWRWRLCRPRAMKKSRSVYRDCICLAMGAIFCSSRINFPFISISYSSKYLYPTSSFSVIIKKHAPNCLSRPKRPPAQSHVSHLSQQRRKWTTHRELRRPTHVPPILRNPLWFLRSAQRLHSGSTGWSARLELLEPGAATSSHPHLSARSMGCIFLLSDRLAQ